MTLRKKPLVAVGVILGCCLAVLIAVPLLFKDRITERVRAEIDGAVDARVSWGSVGLTFFRDFPNLTLGVGELSVVGNAPFAGDTLASVRRLRFVLDVGSVVTGAGIAGADHAIRAKPIRGLLWIREFLADPPGPVIVVGGGATGCEIAANLAARPGRPATEAGPAGGAPDAGGARVILVSTGGRLLDDLPAAAGRRAARRLGALGVEVRLGTRVVAVAVRTAEDGRPGTTVTLEEGGELRGSETVLATGLAAPAWIGEQGLPTGPDGGLAVDGSLRAAGLARVFGAGDCIDFGPRSLPKLGVYAVREAPVLLENLLATLAGRPLRAYRPQRRALRILNLSDGTALAVWGGLAWMGRGTMAWKEWLDRRFVAEYAGAE